MLNEVVLIGRLGADPEIRRTQDGRPIANFRIATWERWTDKNSGEKREKTEWHSVVIFNEGLCKVVETYAKKGSLIYVAGSLQTRKWQDQAGNDRYSTEVVLQQFNGTIKLLDGKEGGGRPPAADSPDQYGTTKTRGASAQTEAPLGGGGGGDDQFVRELDDEIPF